jgi:PAS domain S-box-containing protein
MHADLDDDPALDALGAAFDCASTGFAVLTIRSRPLRVNAALCDLLGTSRDELLAWDAFFLGEPEHAQDEARQRVAMRTGGLDRYTCERQHTRPRGDRVWLRQTCSVARDASGRPRFIVAEVQDHSEVRELAIAQRRSEELFRHTFEEAALGIVHIDSRARIVRINRALCEMHGYSREELIGRSTLELLADRGEGAVDDVSGLLRGQWRHYTAERRFVRKNGHVWPARVSVSIIRPPGAEMFMVSMVEDLSKQKADERRLRQMAQMLDHATDAIIIHDDGRRIRFWNESAQRLFGWRREQALGRTFAELMGEQAALTEQELASLHERGELAVNVACRTQDGRMLRIERRFTVVDDEDGKPPSVLSVNREITAP